jgi:hypothetical protein
MNSALRCFAVAIKVDIPLKIAVFWNAVRCSLVETGRRFRRLHGAASDETVVFILAVVRTEISLTFPLSVLRHCAVKAYSGHGCRAPWIIDISTVLGTY